jgi:hypothetical protein
MAAQVIGTAPVWIKRRRPISALLNPSAAINTSLARCTS